MQSAETKKRKHSQSSPRFTLASPSEYDKDFDVAILMVLMPVKADIESRVITDLKLTRLNPIVLAHLTKKASDLALEDVIVAFHKNTLSRFTTPLTEKENQMMEYLIPQIYSWNFELRMKDLMNKKPQHRRKASLSVAPTKTIGTFVLPSHIASAKTYTTSKAKTQSRTESPSLQTQPRQKCANCRTETTPLWRKDKANNRILCNACALYYKTNNRDRPVA